MTGLYLKVITLYCVALLLTSARHGDDDDDDDVYTSFNPKKREPTPCEICKFFVTEFENRLAESAKSKEIIRTGHGLEPKKKEFEYLTSELRLTEALHEPHICDNILEYNVHAERAGSRRYAKGMSETFKALRGLVNKGVDVDIGMPYDLWDKPAAEVTKMQRKCFNMVEYLEDDIEEWYYDHQDQNLSMYLCKERYLPRVDWKDDSCLDEEKIDFEQKAKDDEEKRKQKEEEKRLKEQGCRKKKSKKKRGSDWKAIKGETGKDTTVEQAPNHTEL